jgi:hypothetical protein
MRKEMLLTLVGLKPALDALRVLGSDEDHLAGLSPTSELMATKLAETFSEAIPASVLQAVFMVSQVSKGEGVSLTAVTSIAMSIVATAYSMTALTYDSDIGEPQWQ